MCANMHTAFHLHHRVWNGKKILTLHLLHSHCRLSSCHQSRNQSVSRNHANRCCQSQNPKKGGGGKKLCCRTCQKEVCVCVCVCA